MEEDSHFKFYYLPTLRATTFACFSVDHRLLLADKKSLVYTYSYTNLPVSDIVGLPHPQSVDRQGQETFLAPSADKQTCNYDT